MNYYPHSISGIHECARHLSRMRMSGMVGSSTSSPHPGGSIPYSTSKRPGKSTTRTSYRWADIALLSGATESESIRVQSSHCITSPRTIQPSGELCDGSTGTNSIRSNTSSCNSRENSGALATIQIWWQTAKRSVEMCVIIGVGSPDPHPVPDEVYSPAHAVINYARRVKRNSWTTLAGFAGRRQSRDDLVNVT